MADNSQVKDQQTPGTTPPANGSEPAGSDTLYAGKFQTDSELEQSYLELQRKLGEKDEFAKLGRALHEQGEGSIEKMEEYLRNRDEFSRWNTERQTAAQAPKPEATVDEFWSRAAKDPKGEIAKLVEPLLQERLRDVLGPVQSAQAAQQEELVWSRMRQRPGFADAEKDFREWVSKTQATPENLYDLYQARQDAERLRRELAGVKSNSRDVAAMLSGSKDAGAAQPKLERARTYEQALENAVKLRQAGVKYSV